MKRILFAFGMAAVSPILVNAQYPDLSQFTIAPAATTTFPDNCEVPPWIIPGGGTSRSYFLVNGIGSKVFSADGSPITASALTPTTYPTQATSPVGESCPWTHFSTLEVKTPSSGVRDASDRITLSDGFSADANTTGEFVAEIAAGYPSGQDWRRTYYGIYSAQSINHPTQGTISLGFIHSENRTACYNNHICDNTINTLQLATFCPSSSENDWERYNGFVCASWVPNVQSTNWGQQYFDNDIGPIVWPATGYLQPNNVKWTCGARHPSSIIYNGYIYVFFLDCGSYGGQNQPPFYPPYEGEGRQGGIKVARVPISDALNPGAYTVFYRDPNGVETWNPSLPAGFTKETMASFLNVPGPKSTDIMDMPPNLSGPQRFCVAAVRNTGYFIGVETYQDETDINPVTNFARWKVALRYSSDLVHWTTRQRIVTTADDWSIFNLSYAALLGSDGWSNNVVDANDFYVVGSPTNMSSWFSKVHIYLPQSSLQFRLSKSQPASAFVIDSIPNSGTSLYPNPTSGVFHLSYSLNSSAAVQINVLDVTGKSYRTGSTVSRSPGSYSEDIDISGYAKGVYLVELRINDTRQTFKLIYQN